MKKEDFRRPEWRAPTKESSKQRPRIIAVYQAWDKKNNVDS